MKILLTTIFLTVSFLTFGQDSSRTKNIVGKWKHSHEEDVGKFQIYRPSGYNFPLSRGREGFEIIADGTFILYRISPNDSMDKMEGKWRMKCKNTIVVSDDKMKNILIIKIAESKPSFLKLVIK